jgi:hypothetical protein
VRTWELGLLSPGVLSPGLALIRWEVGAGYFFIFFSAGDGSRELPSRASTLLLHCTQPVSVMSTATAWVESESWLPPFLLGVLSIPPGLLLEALSRGRSSEVPQVPRSSPATAQLTRGATGGHLLLPHPQPCCSGAECGREK